MIKLRNVSDFIVNLKIVGTVTSVSTYAAGGYDFSPPMPFNGLIKAIWAAQMTPGTTGTESYDILDVTTSPNGGGNTPAGSFLLTGSNLIQFASTASVATYATNFGSSPLYVTAGDILKLYCKTAHSGTAGADTVVALVIAMDRAGVDQVTLQVGTSGNGTYGQDLDAIV